MSTWHMFYYSFFSVYYVYSNGKKKPPARLKPLVNHSRQGSVIRVIDDSEGEIPSIIMNGASLIQNVAFSTDCDPYEDKSM